MILPIPKIYICKRAIVYVSGLNTASNKTPPHLMNAACANEKGNIVMKWTFEKPKKPGNYWYKRDTDVLPGLTGKPRILYVDSTFRVPQLNLFEYKEPVSIEEYKGQWAGPINEPEEKGHDVVMYSYETE